MICKYCNKRLPNDALYCCYCGKLQARLPNRPHRGNREGYACHMKNSRKWTGRVCYFAGSRKCYHQKGGFSTEREALDWCRDWYRNRTEKPPAPPLSAYWDIYSADELERLSASKQTAYRGAWMKLAPLHTRAVDTIVVDDLRKTVKASCPSYYTARDAKVLLSHLFRLAGADGYVQKDLPSYIILPKLESKEAEIFTDEEIFALWSDWNAVPTLPVSFILLMLHTGMMPGEAADLTVDNVDLDKRQIIGAGKKTAVRKAAPIYVPDAIVPVLEWLVDQSEHGKLFRINRDNLYREYHAACQRVGIRDLPPYSCRHTIATRLSVDKNAPLQVIRKVMRWSERSKMVGHYSHPTDDDALKLVNDI